MKITESQLRQIIKKELKEVLDSYIPEKNPELNQALYNYLKSARHNKPLSLDFIAKQIGANSKEEVLAAYDPAIYDSWTEYHNGSIEVTDSPN
jgi:predicted component of type VI protein secretion system